MDWTWIPIIGLIKNGIAIQRAQRAYFVCHAAASSCWDEYNATGPLFDKFTQSMLVTGGTLVGLLLIIRVYALLVRRSWKSGVVTGQFKEMR